MNGTDAVWTGRNGTKMSPVFDCYCSTCEEHRQFNSVSNLGIEVALPMYLDSAPVVLAFTPQCRACYLTHMFTTAGNETQQNGTDSARLRLQSVSAVLQAYKWLVWRASPSSSPSEKRGGASTPDKQMATFF